MESATASGAGLPLLPAWQRTNKAQSGRLSNGTSILHRSLSQVQIPLGQPSARHGLSHLDKLSSRLHHHDSALGRSHFPSLPSEHDGEAKVQPVASHPSFVQSQSQTSKAAAGHSSSKMGADTWFIKQQQYEALIEDLQGALKVRK